MELPSLFTMQFDELLTPMEEKAFFTALDEEHAPTAIRVHPWKTGGKNDTDISSLPIVAPIPWSKHGYYLQTRPDFAHDPLFQTGSYYVQDASTQLLECALDLVHSEIEVETILDACAAPGGKTTHLLSYFGEDTFLVANEVIATRVRKLEENVLKWGYPNVVVTSKDPKYFEKVPEFFDLVVVDAPCSGEGLFRKNKAARSEWSPEAVVECHLRQKRILTDLAPSVKAGGYVIYSTCTWNTMENEMIVEYMQEELGFEGVEFEVPEEWNLFTTTAGNTTCIRTFPHMVEGEGFFMAILRKPLELERDKMHEKKFHHHLKPVSNKEVLTWCRDPKKWQLFEEQGTMVVYPKHLVEQLKHFSSILWPESFGIPVAEQKGKEIVCTHAYTQSIITLHDAFPRIELSQEDAMRYLKKEECLWKTPHQGYALVTYLGQVLGAVNISKHKITNLLPKERRVV